MSAMIDQILSDSKGTEYERPMPASLLNNVRGSMALLLEWIYSHGEKPGTD